MSLTWDAAIQPSHQAVQLMVMYQTKLGCTRIGSSTSLDIATTTTSFFILFHSQLCAQKVFNLERSYSVILKQPTDYYAKIFAFHPVWL